MFELQPSDSISISFFEGFDKNGVAGKKISFKSYNLLPEDTTLKSVYKWETAVARSLYSLRVLPLWYFTNGFIFIYIIFTDNMDII